MTTTQALRAFHEDICNNARDLVTERGTEYAVDTDTLRVFKQAGEMAIESPSKIAYIMLCVKVARLENQMLHSHNITDTVYDLINYVIYAYDLYNGEQGN